MSDVYHAFMMDHASGALGDAMQLAGDLHVRLSAKGADTADIWSIVGGAMLEMAPDAGPDTPSSLPVRRRACLSDAEFEQLARHPERANWRRSLFGFETVGLGRGLGRLIRLKPGRSVPQHGHSHFEATVILSGAFDDGHGLYGIGDIVFAQPGHKHRPISIGSTDCICYVARGTRAALKRRTQA